MAEWTFDEAENVACVTVRQIFNAGEQILLVFHDEDDHSWQFLTGEEITADDTMLVSMRQIVDYDPTLLEIGLMPPGYQAIRAAVGESWEVGRYTE